MPYEGGFIGEEQYMVYMSAVLNDGYEFSADMSAEDISWIGEMENFTVIELTADRLVFTYSVTAKHDIDWDTYESESSTCISHGYWKYQCTGCDRIIAVPDIHTSREKERPQQQDQHKGIVFQPPTFQRFFHESLKPEIRNKKDPGSNHDMQCYCEHIGGGKESGQRADDGTEQRMLELTQLVFTE